MVSTDVDPQVAKLREIRVRASAGRGGEAKATWGQTAIWRCIRWQSRDPAYFNFIRILPLPPGTGEPALADALASLAQRHDALRTGFHLAADGTLIQSVRPAIDLRVAVHEADEGKGDELAQDIADRLKRVPFRSGDPHELPVRCALVTQPPPAPPLLVFVFDHLALDGSSAQLLQEELLDLLADPAARPTAPAGSPLDLAAFEAGPDGERASAMALAHWRRNLPTLPRSLFDHPGRTPLNPRFRRYGLESSAAAVAATLAAARNRVSTSTVLLTAVSAALAARSGHERLALQLIAANRLDARRAALVAPQAQNALFVFDGAGLGFDAAVRRCAVSALAAYAAAAYDPAGLDEVCEEAAAEPGAAFDLSVYFNDVRRHEHWEDLPEVRDVQELEKLAQHSAIVPAGEWDEVDARFFVDVQYSPNRCRLYAQVDTAWITREETEAWLLGVERLLMRAAFADVPPAPGNGASTLAAAVGVAPVERGPDWVRRGPDWVRPADAEDAVQAVPKLIAPHDAAGADH